MTSYFQVWGIYDSCSALVFVMYFVKTLLFCPPLHCVDPWLKTFFFSFFLFITGILMVMDRFQGQVTLWQAVDINLLTNQDLLSCWVTESLNLEVTCKSGGHKISSVVWVGLLGSCVNFFLVAFLKVPFAMMPLSLVLCSCSFYYIPS